jgi:amino acid transporter
VESGARQPRPLESAVAVDQMKRLLVGRALPSHKLEHQLLPKWLALPVFASDQLSSVAYATEQMMLILVAAGAAAFSYMLPIGIAIAALLAIVVTSYRQTARAYPRGGGSYIVARENLGTIPGLVAAAAIQASYVLTVAVSVTAGTIAVTSGLPGLARYKVAIAVGFIALVMLANLRGVKEAGRLFAVPTYGFVALVLLTLVVGLWRCAAGCPMAETAGLEIEAASGVTMFLILRAFSSGATALTGVEAIADGVQAFRRPQSKNAAATLSLMAIMSIPMFLGITLLARLLRVRVNEEIALSKSVLAQIGQTVFDGGFWFFALQALTAGILVLAANTAYQDFPRLSAILARDRFMPSQFKNRGDRLVFSNGIVVLSLLAGLLVFAFDAELSRLIHLYVVGVFTALTLSQAGMVRRWSRLKSVGWRQGVLINGVGALATGLVLAVIAVTQFALGAWMVILAIPIIVSFFLAVRHHYETVGRLLRGRYTAVTKEPRNIFVVLVPDLNLATREAIAYLRALRPERVIPLYTGPSALFDDTAMEWTAAAPRLGRLEPLPMPQGKVRKGLHQFLRNLQRDPDDFLTVIVPETLSGRGLGELIRSRAMLLLKASLIYEPGVVVTDVPLLPEEWTKAARHAKRPVEPDRTVVLVPVSAVNDATLRAVTYARSMNATVVEALFFASEPQEVGPIIEEWARHRMDVGLSAVEAPFRDLRIPLLEEVRRQTDRGDTIVTVVLPEIVVRHWWEHLLHNQTALSFKRLLLFEPDVVVTSVPYHLATVGNGPSAR